MRNMVESEQTEGEGGMAFFFLVSRDLRATKFSTTFLCEVPSASPGSKLIGWRPLPDGGQMPLTCLLVRSRRVVWPPWRVRLLCGMAIDARALPFII
jgi:hypothetical protein